MGAIADEARLQAFNSQPDSERRIEPALRGVLAEIATSGVVRYPWSLLRPLVLLQMRQVLADFDELARVEVGPAPPLADGETLGTVSTRLTGAVEAFEDAPFTVQRLAELLLEPQKQYSRLDKLVLALEKLLLVTSTVGLTAAPPPAPALDALPPVNENPRPQPIDSTRAAALPRGAGHEKPLFGATTFGSLTAGTDTQSLPGIQVSPLADIDRLQDSTLPDVQAEELPG